MGKFDPTKTAEVENVELAASEAMIAIVDVPGVPIEHTTLRGHVGHRFITIAGPCGAAHRMTKTQARVLSEWLREAAPLPNSADPVADQHAKPAPQPRKTWDDAYD